MQTRHPLAIASVRFGRSIARSFDALCRDVFAPYMVLDSYGMCELCYTEAEAREWLPYAAASACIVKRKPGSYSSGTVVARRKQSLGAQ